MHVNCLHFEQFGNAFRRSVFIVTLSSMLDGYKNPDIIQSVEDTGRLKYERVGKGGFDDGI